MAKHGSIAGLLFNGYDLSPYFMNAQDDSGIETSEVTCFGPLGSPVTAKSYVAGLEEGTLSCDGVFDSDTTDITHDKVDDVLSAAVAAAKDTLTYVPFGDGFGNPA